MSLYMVGYIIFDFLCIIGGIIWPYLFCYFATRTTKRVLSIGDSVYDMNWYEFPVTLQKYITLIIARSQKEVHFTGFTMVRCTLAVFGQVRSYHWFIIAISYGIINKKFFSLARLFKHLVRIIWFADNFSKDKSGIKYERAEGVGEHRVPILLWCHVKFLKCEVNRTYSFFQFPTIKKFLFLLIPLGNIGRFLCTESIEGCWNS